MKMIYILNITIKKKQAGIRVKAFNPRICIDPNKSVKINCTDLKEYLVKKGIKESDINNIQVKTTVNWRTNSPQKLEDLLFVKSPDQEKIDYLKLSFVSVGIGDQINLLQKRLPGLTLILQKDSNGSCFENLTSGQKSDIRFNIELDGENLIYLGYLKELGSVHIKKN